MWASFWERWRDKRTIKVYTHCRPLLLAVIISGILGCTLLWLQVNTTPSSVLLPVSSSLPHALQSPSRLLPYKHWEHRRSHPENYNQISCSKFPRLEDIHYAAASWQHLQVKNGSVYIYGAYWDDRFDQPLVRILVYGDVVPLPTLICQIWYEDENAPITVPSTVTYAWQPAWGGYKDGVNEPYILACRARRHPPEKQRPPVAVSIVLENQLCGMPTNVLNVQGVPLNDATVPPLNKSTISVCLKWLQFRDDLATELVEWIEMIKAFGADKLFVFEVQSHPNIRRVLDYYVETGFAEVTEFMHAPQLRSTFAPWEQDFHDYRRELLPLNDCLYRSIHQYQWLTPIDRDEIIVPHSYKTWQQIIAEETKGIKGLDALAFRHYFFLDEVQRDLAAPPYMKILGHFWRSKEPKPQGHNIKSFHNTSSVVAMHNHYPMSCGVSRSCWSRNVNETVARLHHYRTTCTGNCEAALHDIVRDDTVAKWKHVIKKVDQVLTTIGIKPNV